jgi:putative glycosyltransferase
VASPRNAIRLSIVTSLYGSSAYIDEFCRRADAAARALTPDFEIVLVNDGSPDDSLAVALAVCKRNPRVRLIDLSRNFGHHKALMTGLAHARGELVFLIDVDLEEHPEWLTEFHGVMRTTGADVVYGVQRKRRGGWYERMSGAIFYKVPNLLLTPRVPENVITARLMSRRYVRALVQHRDREICLSGLWVITGFDQQALAVDKAESQHSSYTWRRRISVLVNAVTSFSNRPLVYVFYLGTSVMLLALLAAAALIVRALRHGIGTPGYASLMVSIWFLGGLTIFSIGIVGVYVAKIFTESKDRPYTIVRAEYGATDDERTRSEADSGVLRA